MWLFAMYPTPGIRQIVLMFALGTTAPLALAAAAESRTADRFHLATFSLDVTPPIGEPVGLGFVPFAQTVEHPLLAKGVILEDSGGRYVLTALDWMEVHNDSYDTLRERIAAAADTAVSRVALQCLHQHTAPAIDAHAQRLQLSARDPPARRHAVIRT